MSVAACLIARNGVQTLPRLLDSIRSHVDEVCVYLAGESSDGTPELLERIARQPGAPIVVEQGVWNDDYAEARNRSFDMASSDHLMWFDDDEILEGGERLRELLAHGPDAVWMRRIDVWRESVGWNFRLKVVRAGLGLKWVHPIHELLGDERPTSDRWSIAPPDRLRVIHHPMKAPSRHKHRALIERTLARDPGVRQLRLYLARHLLWDDGDLASAAVELERVVGTADPWQLHERNVLAWAFHDLAICKAGFGDARGALSALRMHDHIRATPLVFGVVRDPFWDRLYEFNAAYPVAVDDPACELRHDPRSASEHEPRDVLRGAS